jgi:hypothetical protein
LSPRGKRIAVVVGLIALVASVGVAVHGPSRSLHDARILLQRAGIATAKPSATYTTGPATKRLRELLKLYDGPPAGADTINDASACGLEQLDAALNGEKQAVELLAQAQTLLGEVATRMGKSTIEQERAIGLVALIGNAEFATAEHDTDEAIRCLNDETCIAKKMADREQAISPYVTALAQMADATKDPNVYAAAFYTCRNSEAPACKAISAERWSQMDRSNAVPLLFTAGAQKRPEDIAIRDQALIAASNAVLYEPRLLPVLSLSQSDAVQKAPPAVRLLIDNQLASQFIGNSVIDYTALFSHCKPPANDLPGRRDSCNKLAEKIAQQDNTLIGLNMARIVGTWMGWSTERIASMKDENDAAMQIGFTAFGFGDTTSCRGAVQFGNYVNDLARIGEMPALRQRIANSGKSASALAEEYRSAARKRVAEEAAEKAVQPPK